MLRKVTQFLHSKIIAALFFGCANGLPLGLIVSTLNAWLEIAGISRSTIGLFSLVGVPYILKFLWSPLIDHYCIPLLSRKFGQRTSWLILTQTLLSCSIIKLGSSSPLNTYSFALWALIVSIFAATQETILDAYRVELLDKNQQGIGATSVALGYSVGLALSGGGSLLIVDSLCRNFQICEDFTNWRIAYTIFAITIFVGSIAALIVGEPKIQREKMVAFSNKGAFQWLLSMIFTCIVKPFIGFMETQKWFLVLIFVTIYRTCDAFIAPMINPFFLDIGFTLTDIALVAKTFGFFATICGSVLGGILTYRIGVIKSLFICGLGQMLSNIMFIIQARVGDSMTLLYLSIAAENIGGAMAIAVFIAYIASLCHASQHTATQYSFLTALSSINYFLAASVAGWVAENFGWVTLFSASVLFGIPPLIILYFLRGARKSVASMQCLR